MSGLLESMTVVKPTSASATASAPGRNAHHAPSFGGGWETARLREVLREQVFPVAGICSRDDLTIHEHIGTVCRIDRERGILLCEQDRGALASDLTQGLEDLVDDDRRETHRRLVEGQEA